MNRSDFKRLAQVRIEESKILLDRRKYDGAYYLAGYAVECALKACIAKLTKRHDFPDKRFALRCFTHDIEELLSISGLRSLHDADIRVDPDLRRHWQAVKDWSEESRYQRWSRTHAESLFTAVTDTNHGVLPWVKRHW